MRLAAQIAPFVRAEKDMKNIQKNHLESFIHTTIHV
jgi:hypothetical protein